MAKHDLKKLALLGLASGLIVANPVSADADQQLLSQLNGAGTGLVARLIASASAGDNATPDQDQILRQQRQNSGAGPRTTSGLRNDSGAKGPGGVRETSSRDHMYRDSNGTEQGCAARSGGRENQSHRQNQNKANNENNNNNNNAPRGPLALNDNYNSTKNGTVNNTGKNVNNMDPNAVKTGTMNQSSRGQGVKTTVPSNIRTIDQGGKTNTPSNQPSNELPINTNHTNKNDHLALNDYIAGGSCGSDGSYGGSGGYGSQDDNMYQSGHGSSQRGHRHHSCGSASCSGNSYEQNNNSVRVRSSDQGRQQHHNRMRSQDQMQNPNQTQGNHMGGQKTGFTDQTQPQTRQRPNATSNQGINTQRQNSQRQQPQSNLGQ